MSWPQAFFYSTCVVCVTWVLVKLGRELLP